MPQDYIKIGSGLGEAAPADILVMPVLFEDQVLGRDRAGVVAAVQRRQPRFLDQITETIGVVLNTIQANMRTEELLSSRRA